MKKIMKYIACINLLLLLSVLNINNNVYAISKDDAKELKEGDYLEITSDTKPYIYEDALPNNNVNIKKMKIAPGYEDGANGKGSKPGIPKNTKLQAMKIDNSGKCYIEEGSKLYISINWGQMDCFVLASAVKKTKLTDEQKKEINDFLDRSNVKKVKNKKTKQLDDDTLIKLAEDGQKVFIDTGNQDVNDIVNAVEVELKNRGYSYVVNDEDGSVEIKDKNGKVVGKTKGGDLTNMGTIYNLPKKEGPDEAGDSLDDMMDDADTFIEEGSPTYGDGLADVSNTIYNILLTVGVTTAVVTGAMLGIKLMLSSVEEKVQAKKLLVPYVVGCVVIFGGFGIWKLVVTILQGV